MVKLKKFYELIVYNPSNLFFGKLSQLIILKCVPAIVSNPLPLKIGIRVLHFIGFRWPPLYIYLWFINPIEMKSPQRSEDL